MQVLFKKALVQVPFNASKRVTKGGKEAKSFLLLGKIRGDTGVMRQEKTGMLSFVRIRQLGDFETKCVLEERIGSMLYSRERCSYQH